MRVGTDIVKHALGHIEGLFFDNIDYHTERVFKVQCSVFWAFFAYSTTVFYDILLCSVVIADFEGRNEWDNLVVLYDVKGDFARFINKPFICFFESLNRRTLL